MVTRAELAAQRAAGVPQEGRLAALKTQREAGLSVDDQEMKRLQRVEAAAMEAFGAATLLEAQEAIGLALPGVVSSITLSMDFDSPTGAAPQTTATRTLTVPSGNPGIVIVEILSGGGLRYSLAGAPNTLVSDGETFDADTTNTLDFTVTSAPRVTQVRLRDLTTAAWIGAAFTITTT